MTLTEWLEQQQQRSTKYIPPVKPYTRDMSFWFGIVSGLLAISMAVNMLQYTGMEIWRDVAKQNLARASECLTIMRQK